MHRVPAILVLSFFSVLSSFAAEQRPNILFILTEDQGAHMGALGTTDVKTPHMDALAASGALFRRAYVGYPVCSASKACIMTGLHSHTNGLINNTNNFFKPASKLTEAEKKAPPYLHTRIRSQGKTMVEVLAAQGYHTAVCGKLHIAPNERFPYNDFIPKAGSKQALTAVIKRSAGRPWFLLHNSTTFTHRPFVNSEKQPITIDPAKVKLPAHLPDTTVARRDWAEYLDGVQHNDQVVGEVMATLRESGQEANTLVIFMGDHGPAYQHGKMTPFHLGLHIPLVIRLPRCKPLVSDALVSELDLLPTLLDLLGIQYDSPLHGISLRPLLEAKPDAKGHDFIFSEVSGRSLNQQRGMEERSVIDATHQLIVRSHLDEPKVINADLRDMKPWINRIYGETVRVKAQFPEAYRILQEMDPHALGGIPPLIELYDLQSDPDELHNLAPDPTQRAHLERLYAALKQWHTDTQDNTMILPSLP
ncbi:MAG: sulfatase-like hydrolase/transferase [Prosthecobacter sp.]|uniref:sulfatase-like hydrolase/transferase n=1 Tax=Prosthecobacter sp. TaxID=1965333 RepID=UPI003BAF3F9A